MIVSPAALRLPHDGRGGLTKWQAAVTPAEMFGKLMSVSDELMARYYQLLLGESPDPALHPMDAKKSLAEKITARYHGGLAAIGSVARTPAILAAIPALAPHWRVAMRSSGMSDAIRHLRRQAESLWLQRHEPAVWARTHTFCFLSGFLTLRLTGRRADSVGCQVGYVPFDYRRGRWARRLDWRWRALGIRRGGERLVLRVVIGRYQEGERVVGRFGAAIAKPGDLWQDLRAVSRLGVVDAAAEAVTQTWRMSWLTLRMLGRMVTGDVSVKNVSGPIQIAQVAGVSAQIGLVSFLSFMAIVSVSLGVLNLLPVPVLDGGHLLYYFIEALTGSPVSERTQAAGQRLGLTLLALLMGLAFYNDIVRLLN